MNEISNIEDIIKFDQNAYVRITKSQFEYHCGVLNDYEFIVPIENIRRVNFKDRRLSNNLGCNIFVAILDLIVTEVDYIAEPSYRTITDVDTELKNTTLTLRYKTNKQKRWASRDISWPGLTKAKGEKIIRILKLRNKNLP
ncbi:hypothetical protein ACG2LH_15605 [Zhouia sp. PK063]|uniref:hypothetical protein n=1 Tax=Zhouia sp. PK063 TaxID=3373602 RepID=UPI0037B90BF1